MCDFFYGFIFSIVYKNDTLTVVTTHKYTLFIRLVVLVINKLSDSWWVGSINKHSGIIISLSDVENSN